MASKVDSHRPWNSHFLCRIAEVLPTRLFVVGLSCALFVGACSLTPKHELQGTERWQVVNRSENPPNGIANASILVTYHRTAVSPGHSMEVCERAVLVMSNELGWITIPSYDKYEVRLYPFKDDFVLPLVAGSTDYSKRVVYLEPSNGIFERKMDTFSRLYGGAGCAQVGIYGTAIAEFVDRVLPSVKATFGKEDTRVRNWEGKREVYRNIARQSEGLK